MPLDRSRDLDRVSGIDGRAMCDGKHCDDVRSVGFAFDCEHDDARAILASFFPSRLVFAVPEIGVADDETRLRSRDFHAAPLRLVEQGIEMRVPRIHAGRADRLHLRLGQTGCGKASAALLEALERRIFVRPDEVPGDLIVARNGHGCALRLHTIATEIAGELGGRNGGCHARIPFIPVLPTHNSRKMRKLRESCVPPRRRVTPAPTESRRKSLAVGLDPRGGAFRPTFVRGYSPSNNAVVM